MRRALITGLAILLVLGVLFLVQRALLQSVTQPVTGNTATPAPSEPTAYAVGQTVTSTTGDSFTVLGLTTVKDSDPLITPPPGGSFLGVDVKICAASSEYPATAAEWNVVLSDGTEEPMTLMVEPSEGPQFPTEEVQPGACATGWVYFALPASPAPARVTLADADWYWTVS